MPDSVGGIAVPPQQENGGEAGAREPVHSLPRTVSTADLYILFPQPRVRRNPAEDWPARRRGLFQTNVHPHESGVSSPGPGSGLACQDAGIVSFERSEEVAVDKVKVACHAASIVRVCSSTTEVGKGASSRRRGWLSCSAIVMANRRCQESPYRERNDPPALGPCGNEIEW